ncbi:hypothetical protein JCM10207_008948 [Rhodosporidiobolus poonsookiae]
MSLLRSAARSLRLGKFKYWQGADLEGNQFYERPHPEYPDEWRKNKRYVEYAVARPLSDYDYQSIPVQWTSWLRRTRRAPPSLQELQVDLARQIRLQDNVARLADEYREEKLRLAESDRMARLQAPELAEGIAPDAPTQQEGLPVKDGGMGLGGRAGEVAREIGTGVEKVEGDKIQRKEESPEEQAKRKKEEERQAALKRREEFARQNPATPKGRPTDGAQPEGWSPAPTRRRRA